MNYLISSRFAILSVLSLSLDGCGIHIDAPQPPPDVSPPQMQVSSVSLPITLDLTPIIAQLENVVPKEQNSSNTYFDVPFSIAGNQVCEMHAVTRDPLAVSMDGNQLSVSTTLHSWFKIAMRVSTLFGGHTITQIASAGVNEPQRRAIVKFDSTISTTPDYTLTATTHVEPINFLDPIRLTVLNIDFTNKLRDILQPQLDKVPEVIDPMVPGFTNAKPLCQKAWDSLSAPINLAPDLWLLINPQAVSASNLNGTGNTVIETLSLTAKPEVISGTQPSATSTPLPPLSQGSSANNFHVSVKGTLNFDDATKTLSDKVVGRMYPISGHPVKIEKIDIYGTGQEVVAQVTVSGDLAATVFLVGKPTYNPDTGNFYIPDLDYSIETKNVLAKVADWFLHDEFKKSLQAETTWNLTGDLSKAKELLHDAINRRISSNVTLSGTVNDPIQPTITSTSSAFIITATVDGTIAAHVTP